MRRIFNWIKKAVTFDADVTVKGDLNCKSHLIVDGTVTLNGQLNCDDLLNCEGQVDLNDIVNMPGLPTSDPAVEGELWNNAGVLNISAG